MASSESMRRALDRLTERLQRFGEMHFPKNIDDGLAPITLEDRPIILKFMREVYHEGQDEHLWAARHPESYRKIIAIAGTVRRPKKENE